MTLLKKILCLVVLNLPVLAFGGGIRGTIKADDGTVLSYATIYVKQLGTGTTTNENGFYELSRPPGTYDLVYQYLGYETQEQQVTVGEGFEVINITLKSQVVVLQNITITSG